MNKNLPITLKSPARKIKAINDPFGKKLLSFLFFLTAFLISGQNLLAQTTTITTEIGSGFDGANTNSGNSAVTFVVQNTNTYDITLTGVDMFWSSSYSGTIPSLWYSASSLSGAPTITPTVWTKVATGAAVTIPTSGYYPALTNLTVTIPANTQYRFALQSSLGVNYSGLSPSLGAMLVPSPSVFTSGGVTLKVYDEKINALNVGYAGNFPNPAITASAFTGRIKFQPSGPCTSPPAAGQAVSSAATVCPNKYFVLGLTGLGTTTGLQYQWQSSPDGVAYTNIAGATTPYYNALQTATTHYRAQITCTGQTVSSASVLVNTTAVPVSGTYTINKGNPATATNFQSFAAAIDFIDCGAINGPVIFNVVAGSGPYNEQVVIPAITGASATNTITVNGNGNSLINPNATGDLLKLDGADFFRFNNLTIQAEATATTGALVALVNGADDNIFTGCTLNHSTNTTTTSYGVMNTTGSDNNTIQNSTITGAYYGIYSYGASATTLSNNQFKGNMLKDQHFYGIYTLYSTNTLIEGNDISRPTRTNGDGMYGIYAGTGIAGITISKNRIHNTHNAATSKVGIVYGIYNGSAGTTGTPHMIINNAIYNINNDGGTLYAFYNTGGNNTFYYHNTVSADMPGITYTTLRGMYFLSASTNVKFINNNISLSNAAISKHAIYLTSATIALQSNNNNLFVPNGSIGFSTTDHNTLTTWRTVNSGAYDQASVSADPEFANLVTGLLRPTNSSLNNVGQAMPTITDDIAGATRSITTPDPGAFEFTPLVNDAGIEAVVSPVSSATPGISTPIQATIKNYGSAILTSATLGFSVNGTTVVNNYAFTGNLSNNAISAALTIGNYTFPAGSYDLCVWVTSPNGLADGNTKNDTTCVTIYSCAPLVGNYTINKGLPASATNFQSLVSAANTLNNCGISGPVTFTVATGSGPYSGQIALGTINGSSATNTITFQGNGNSVSATPSIVKAGVITLDGTDRVTFNNFVIGLDATATTGWGVQLINGADNNIFSNNTINLPLTSTSTNVNGIVAGVGPTLAGNNTSNSVFMNNTINGGYYGISINGNAGSLDASNNQIKGNTILDTYMYNVYLNNTDVTLVENNDISRPNRTVVGAYYGVYMSGAKTTTVSKNRMHNTHGGATSKTGSAYGVYHNNSDSPVFGAESIVKNNLIYDFNFSGAIYVLYNSGSDGVHYLNNTIEINNTTSAGKVGIVYQTVAASNIKIQNNIFTLDGGASGMKHILNFATPASVIISNHNVLHATNNAKVGYYGADFATLALWQTANTGAFDQNSVAADPLFLNLATGNLTPTSVAVNNLGTPLTTVTDDILGNPRSTTTPDQGAYEFTINPNDVGITAISGPVTGCGLTGTEVITATISNYGTSTQTSIPVSLYLNGVNLTPTPETWTGTLAANSTTTYTFTATANLSTANTYSIVATTNLTGDSNNSNNPDTISVTNSLMAGLPDIDFETAGSGLSAIRKVTNLKSAITENTAASSPLSGPPTASTKGMLMEATASTGWIMPVGLNDPWSTNPDHFSAAYLCFSPAGGPVGAPLWLAFDLKQSFKIASPNTNFRVTVNGTPVGGNQATPANTYRPPFDGIGGTTNWTKIYIDLAPYQNLPFIEIGLESSVSEPYTNGAGPANLIDNVKVLRFNPTGVNNNVLQSSVNVYPNPSNGAFSINVPTAKAYSLEVTDLTGRVVKTATVQGNVLLDLSGNAKGVYMLKITSEGTSAIKKLIVQ